MTHAHHQQGFTLIELLITLAGVTLLASLAWPSYQSLILRSQRAQARASLLQIDGQRYKMSVTSTAQSYTLSAIPLGTQAADACGTLTINHLGVRSVQGASQTAAQCWSR
jgi:type IV pilus assembly protein PilE